MITMGRVPDGPNTPFNGKGQSDQKASYDL